MLRRSATPANAAFPVMHRVAMPVTTTAPEITPQSFPLVSVISLKTAAAANATFPLVPAIARLTATPALATVPIVP